MQWDPERNIKGQVLNYRSIQVGLSKRFVEKYVQEWIRSITDLTPQVRTMSALVRAGQWAEAESLLPQEMPYPLSPPLMTRLGMR